MPDKKSIMQDKKIIILVVLSVLALFSLIYGIITPSKIQRKAILDSTALVESSGPVAIKAGPDLSRSSKRSQYDSWDKDPFTSKKISEGGTGLVLNGIMWDEEKPMAIINDTIVGIGDQLENNTLLDIQKDKVLLSDGSKTIELK